MEDGFLDVKEAASFLHMSVSRIYQLKATDSTFPCHQVGSKLLFDKQELIKWVKER